MTARPSGTEPKIKFYASWCTEPGVALEEARTAVAARLQRVRRQIEALLDTAKGA